MLEFTSRREAPTLAAFSAALFLLLPACAAASCPSTCAIPGSACSFCTPEAVLDTICLNFSNGFSTLLHADATTGHFVVRSAGYAISGGGSFTFEDDYWVDGPPGGGPVSFAASLRCTTQAWAGILYAPEHSCGTASVAASLRDAVNSDGFSRLANTPYPCPGPSPPPEIRILVLPQARLVGEVFRLRVSGSSDEEAGDAFLKAQLRFTELPFGYTVRSCRGYASDNPTAVSRRSWGDLKVRYH
jgi:hypothetical protein